MNRIAFLILLFPFISMAQLKPIVKDSVDVKYVFVKGDSLAKEAIDLDEVILMNKLKFENKDEHIQYLILKRKTLKVYRYAKMAADTLTKYNSDLKLLTKKREQRRYSKRMQRFIEDEFSEELKKLTRTEGQILVKLIHRQTGITTYNLIKDLRSGWKAFWYNNTAKLFDISLKAEFDPRTSKEDFFIEDILQRAFQDQYLEKQKPALEFNYYDLVDAWNAKNKLGVKQ
ncbi:MAG: hypothetical protein BM564_02640 [Bacteroidetes bacterium MedPE-SWsnd-G2]|nr:MAG: hypothetical protein BM564_02640 [Bacteroidetes bacterium MedPE-SWsnd-G2]